MYSRDDVIKVLGETDGDWYDRGCPIPYNATCDEWHRLEDVRQKIENAADAGEIEPVKKYTDYKPPRVMVVSDELSPVVNPADGKTYDSKSGYYQAVKDRGLEIVGNDAPSKPSKPKQKPIDWERAVKETLQTNPLKGK